MVDPRERREDARLAAHARDGRDGRWSADGRWAYTLYEGAGSTPLLRALDAKARTARCISLAMLTGKRRFSSLRLRGVGTVAGRGSYAAAALKSEVVGRLGEQRRRRGRRKS
jgi:hypothetical protein